MRKSLVSKKVAFTATLASILFGQEALAVQNILKCLNCFNDNPEDHFFCDASDECMALSAWDCADEDKVYSYTECPASIVEDKCSNYTFTVDNFDQTEPVVVTNELAFGESCYMQIDRQIDGSYGTVALEYDNVFLFVFDEYVPSYESGTLLGLIEQSDAIGWAPRQVFVANGGLMPIRFNAIY